jgi:hypothetical protein
MLNTHAMSRMNGPVTANISNLCIPYPFRGSLKIQIKDLGMNIRYANGIEMRDTKAKVAIKMHA